MSKYKKQKPHKGKSKVKSVIFGAVLVACIALFSWVGYTASYVLPLFFGGLEGDVSLSTYFNKEEPKGDQIVILLTGCDSRNDDYSGRSDSLMIGYVDTETDHVRLISLPRDSYVSIPGYSAKTKINHAMAYGGIELTAETLKENFGVEVDYYAEINFDGFVDLVDALGGVDIDVPKNMYTTKGDGIYIDAGMQHMDGKTALQFCRFRSDAEGDFGRIKRQQQFLTALKEQTLSATTALKVADLCSVVSKNVETDISSKTMLSMVKTLASGFTLDNYSPQNCTTGKVGGVSYVFLPDNIQEFFDVFNNWDYETPVPGYEDETTAAGATDGKTTDKTSSQ